MTWKLFGKEGYLCELPMTGIQSLGHVLVLCWNSYLCPVGLSELNFCNFLE